MTKISIEVSDEDHIKLLEIQLERKKKKEEPTAINKIAAEFLSKSLNENKKVSK